MPVKNVVKFNLPNTYYHVYTRGVAKTDIFKDEKDYHYFLKLFNRYLSYDAQFSKQNTLYPHLRGSVEMLAYCLMKNHVHLLLYQHDATAMTTLLRGVLTSYSMYFNHKYKRTGPLFESRYKAAPITTDTYLQHISRYILLNPRYFTNYQYSSYQQYLKEPSEAWLQPERILTLFDNDPKKYAAFCHDYIDRREVLRAAKNALAGR